jgi:excinuclease ABC subunit C
LVLVDGGRGQLTVAERVLSESQLSIPVAGLAKRLEEVYLPGQPQPLSIPRGSESLFLLQHLRDEAHRFAVTYHRTKRARRALRSPLDDVPGVGAVRKKALLKRFGSLARLRAASVEDVSQTPGVGPVMARSIYDRLHGLFPSRPDRERVASSDAGPGPDRKAG